MQGMSENAALEIFVHSANPQLRFHLITLICNRLKATAATKRMASLVHGGTWKIEQD